MHMWYTTDVLFLHGMLLSESAVSAHALMFVFRYRLYLPFSVPVVLPTCCPAGCKGAQVGPEVGALLTGSWLDCP